MTPIRFVLLVHTKNSMNGNFGNSRAAGLAQASKDREHREAAKKATLAALRRAGVHPADLLPVVVTLTRHSSGHLDEHDGLPSALKRVVDGIALGLGINDGARAIVTWRYRQEKSAPGVHGVVVELTRRGLEIDPDEVA